MAKYNRYYREQKYYLGKPVEPPIFRQGALYEQNVEFETKEECEIGTILPLPDITDPVLSTIEYNFYINESTASLQVDLGHQFKLDSVNHVMTEEGIKLLVYGNPKYINEFVGVLINPDGTQITDITITNEIFGYDGYSLHPICCQTFYYFDDILKLIMYKNVNNSHEFIIVNINMTNGDIQTQKLDSFVFDTAWGGIYYIDDNYIYTEKYIYNYVADEVKYNNLKHDNGYFYFNANKELNYYWWKSYSVPSDISRGIEVEVFNMKQNRRNLYTPALYNQEYFGEYEAIFPMVCDFYYYKLPNNIPQIYSGNALYTSTKSLTDRYVIYGNYCYYEPIVSNSVCTIYYNLVQLIE